VRLFAPLLVLLVGLAAPAGAGGLFVTGHDADAFAALGRAYLNAGLDYLAFGRAARGPEERGRVRVAYVMQGWPNVAARLARDGWDARFVEMGNYVDRDGTRVPPQRWDAVFDGGFQIIVTGLGGDGGARYRNGLDPAWRRAEYLARKERFAAFVAGGGGLYVSDPHLFGPSWYDFVPDFAGIASQQRTARYKVTRATPEGVAIGLSQEVVDQTHVHTRFSGLAPGRFTIFEVDAATGDPVAFGRRGPG
jgi:hypothetical protein